MTDDGAIRVNIITGFLGSGKTTLLRSILSTPAFANAAVLINEAGDEGLDHLLVERLDDSSVLIANGCICCTVRGDFKRALVDLLDRRARGEIPAFDRVVIETTGLADPAPVIATLMRDMTLRHHFRLGHVIATVDAVHGQHSFERHTQIARQIAMADRIILTKTDLASADQVMRLRRILQQINGGAPVKTVRHGVVDAQWLIEDEMGEAQPTGWFTGLAEMPAVYGQRLKPGVLRPDRRSASWASGAASHALPSTLSVRLAEPVEWTAFGLWLSLLTNRHADRILRIKGIIDVEGSDTPVVVHGVQSLLHPAEHLPAWPSGPRETRLVLIAEDMDTDLIARSLRIFLALGRKTADATYE